MAIRKQFAMAVPIALHADFTADQLCRQARRLLALATIYDGGSRNDAAQLGGVTQQIIRDWMVRSNVEGMAVLIDRKAAGRAPNDAASWQAAKPEFAKFARDVHRLCNDIIGPTSIDFSANSCVARKKGKRAWLPMWPRKEGAYVYIPGGDGGTPNQPSDFYAKVRDELASPGVEPSWSFKYNAGANPIAFPIAPQNASHSKMLQIHTEAYALV